MTDMAPRPRGGWQVGSPIARLGRVAAGLEGRGNLAPDCYSVHRATSGWFIVKHYPTGQARQACCVVEVQPEAGESDSDALARAWRSCEAQHRGAV